MGGKRLEILQHKLSKVSNKEIKNEVNGQKQ